MYMLISEAPCKPPFTKRKVKKIAGEYIKNKTLCILSPPNMKRIITIKENAIATRIYLTKLIDDDLLATTVTIPIH